VILSTLRKLKKKILIKASLESYVPQLLFVFQFIPSNGATGGTLIIYKSGRFNGQVISQNKYVMSVEFISTYYGAVWVLTNIYAPCTLEGKLDFLNWLHDFELSEDINWLLVGDFNLIRKPSDHNKPGGNVQEMFKFNEVISNLRLEEFPLQGHKST
jgi:hypothetical protein